MSRFASLKANLTDALTIQEAAATTGWSSRMLRYIERVGLIEPHRTEAGYRLYGPAELQRLRTLRELLTEHDIGLSDIAFAARVRQGFTILRSPRRYALTVALPQILGWGCRVASAAAFLEAFGIPGTVRNAVLVMVVGSLTTLLPVTPGGVGTQQALIVVVLGGAASDGQLLSFSVGMQAAVAVANALIGGLALVLMLRTLSLRSAIGHARHTQRADST